MWKCPIFQDLAAVILDERMDQVEYFGYGRMKITQTNIRAVISVCSEQTRKLCMKIT